MEDITQWIESGGSYAEGLALYAKYARNRILLNHLSRRENMPKLRYELSKYSNTPVVLATKVVPLKTPSQKRKIEYAELPDELKPIFDKVAQTYQEARKAHYAMKAAKTDKTRLKYRDILIERIKAKDEYWTILDAWRLNGELPKPEQPKTPTVASIKTALSRNLDKLTKTEPAADVTELRSHIQAQISELKLHGHLFAPKTIEKLQTFGIEIPK